MPNNGTTSAIRVLRKMAFTAACGFGTLLAAHSSAFAQTPDSAQIEKGRQVVSQVCAACHTTIVRMVQVHKQSTEQWRDTVYFMISRGAQVMPDEIEPVVAYLTANSGKGATGPAPGRGGAGRGAGGGGEQLGPEQQGRVIHQRTCQQCHELATASKKRDDEQWGAVLTRMTAYGARLSPAEHDTLLQYLETLGK